MINEKNTSLSFDLLLDYVEGLVDPATRNRIDQFLTEDEEYRNVVAGIQYYYQQYGHDRAQLEQYLHEFQQRLIKEQVPSKTRRLNNRFLSIAAIVLGLVLTVFLLRNQLMPPLSADGLVAAALKDPYANVYSISRSQATDTLRSQISQWYDREDYQQAAASIQKIIQDNPPAEASDFFMLAQCYLNQRPPAYQQAAEVLKNLLANGVPASLRQQTQWYLAVSQYQSGEKATAKNLFSEIAGDSNHYRKESAQEILDRWK